MVSNTRGGFEGFQEDSIVAQRNDCSAPHPSLELTDSRQHG